MAIGWELRRDGAGDAWEAEASRNGMEVEPVGMAAVA